MNMNYKQILINNLVCISIKKGPRETYVYFDLRARIVLPPWCLHSVGTLKGFEILCRDINKI